MNREIRFKVWDKESKEMLDYIPALEDMNMISFEDLDKSRYELMQYTGLKDKNGKEIYEGDVVKLQDVNEIGQIVWLNNGWYADVKEFYNWGEQLYSWDELEVIGNKWENPELLTNK